MDVSNPSFLIYAALLAGVVLAGVAGDGAWWQVLAIAIVIILLSPPVRRFFSGMAREPESGAMESAATVLWFALAILFLLGVGSLWWLTR